MKIRKKHPVILFLLVAFTINAQAQEILTTAGGSGVTTGARVTWTVGEAVTETAVGTTVVLTQGFNQGDLVITVVSDAVINGLTLKVFPNPATEIVNITGDPGGPDNLRLILIDLFGREIRNERLLLPESQFTVSELKPGIYFLKVVAGNKEIGIYRIIKK